MNADIPTPSPNPAIRWLRVIVWLVPSGLFLGVLLLTVRVKLPSAVSSAIWIAALVVVAGLGYLDGRLVALQQSIPPEQAKRVIMNAALLFFSAQFVMVPIFWFFFYEVVGLP